MLADMPLEELRDYRPAPYREKDFASFWDETRSEALKIPLNYEINEIGYMVSSIEANQVFYDGFDRSRICGYYLLPKTRGPHPAIVWFHGYGGSKDRIISYLKWVLLGYAVLAIDIKGQSGQSLDRSVYPPPSTVGYMTKGVFDPYHYYYRGVYMDCLKAVQFLEGRPEIDKDRICLTGASQGGGLSLAVAALSSLPKLVIADVPYLCHFRRAVQWAEEAKNITYLEFASLIQKFPEKEEQMFKSLSYFDNLNLAAWVKARTVITCATKDLICPPSTIFAVYNQVEAPKTIKVMPFYGHDLHTVTAFDEERLLFLLNYL